MNIILFVLIIGVLVLVHELGHFIVAKFFKIRVDEFAFGFPPRLFSKKFGETEYSINLLPLGGYVKIFGENPNEVNTHGPESERSFVHKTKPVQALVLVACVVMNMLLAWAFFAIAIMIGLPAPNGYAGDKQLINQSTAILEILPNSPAEKAGFLPGDKILSMKSGDESLKNIDVEKIQQFIRTHGDRNITTNIQRGAEQKEIQATATIGVVADTPALGVSLGQVGTLKLPFFQAISEAAKITYYMLGSVAIGLYSLVQAAIVGHADLSQITGPVGIVGLVGEASSVGFAYLLGFTAMISVNLAIINLLPFPALDGGRILFVIIESVIRRPIKPVVANSLNAVGFALLMVLMVVVTYQDIVKLI